MVVGRIFFSCKHESTRKPMEIFKSDEHFCPPSVLHVHVYHINRFP